MELVSLINMATDINMVMVMAINIHITMVMVMDIMKKLHKYIYLDQSQVLFSKFT